MFPPEIWIGGVMLGALIVYAVTGGADFGASVWDLLASGSRKERQRAVIAHAIAPIWEINHVWLVVVVMLLLVAFPLASTALLTALYIPLAVMLVGIMLRGFIFGSYGNFKDGYLQRYRRIFAIASVVISVMLGVTIGAMSSGKIRMNVETGLVEADFISAWCAPFPLAVGGLILALFSFLAAVYLLHETESEDLQEDFRNRALCAGVAVFILAWLSFWLAGDGAPLIREGLWHRVWSVPFQGVMGMMSTAAFAALCLRWYRSARILAVTQAVLLILGWGMAQFPFVIVPDLTFENAAAPESVLRMVLIVLGLFLLILIPSFFHLYRVFKWQKDPLWDEKDEEEDVGMLEVEEE